MLIHKQTRGVLRHIYTGENIRYLNLNNFPRYIQATFENCNIPEEERCNYWEINDKSSLATAINLAYPFFDPICDKDGNLIGIKKWSKTEINQSLGFEIAEEICPDLSILEENSKKKSKKRFISIF